MSVDKDPAEQPAKFLLIGGIRHGQEVEDQGKVYPTIDQYPEGPLGLPGPAMATNYIKRPMRISTPEGVYVREVYVHQSVQQEEFLMALAQYLIGQFVVEGGELLDESPDVLPGGEQEGHSGVEAEAPRPSSGLIIPG